MELLKRWGHASAMTESGIFVHGGDVGWGDTAQRLDDIWQLTFGLLSTCFVLIICRALYF